MTDIEKQILNIKKSDSFFKKLYEIFCQERDDSKKMIVSLHNRGEINFTEEILKLSNQGHDFFNAKNMFEEVLPDLDIPIQKSMDCVRHIFQKSGSGMSAEMVFFSFVEYCKKDKDRVKEALQIINSDTSWYDFIPSVIRAGSEFNLNEYVKIAIKLTKHSDVNVCKNAAYSLGILKYENHLTSLNQSFQVIKNIIETTDDAGVLSISIGAIFTLSIFDDTLEDETIHLIKVALKNSDDSVLHSASNLCCFEREKLSIELFGVLLHGLERVNYKHTGTIDNISYGLQYLLGKNQDMVIAYLEKTLMRNKELSITSFGSLLSDLHQKHNELLNQIITKWFILGNVNLCKATMDIVTNRRMILSADISQLKIQDRTTHLFVIRKAIGWLFHYPTSAVSFIISMVEVLDADNIEIIEELLFDPLLISYSGSIKDYLKSIKKPKVKTKKIISNLLERLEKYHDDLRCAWGIKELQPSQKQRESYFRLHNQQMSKVMQESKKDSVILSLVSEFTVLYGRRSVSYYPELDNSNNDIRQEMTFQKFEHSIEYPSLDFIDPHGLDYMLRIFRNE